jgi:hypothetical protein
VAWQIVSLSNFTCLPSGEVGYSLPVIRLRARPLVVAALATASAVTVAGQRAKEPPIDLAGLLARVGERVEAYYQRAQSIVCLETIAYEILAENLSVGLPRSRRVTYELRTSWEKSVDGDVPEGYALRTLKTVNGKPPKDDKNDDSKCLDPKPTAVDTLSFLLPHNQRELAFTYKGIGKAGGQSAVMIDYAPLSKDKPKYTWHDSCFGVEAPTRTRGRVWIDRFDGNVLRVDETVMGPLDVDVPKEEQRKSGVATIVLDRWDFSIRYKAITFVDPNEVVLLPEQIEQSSTVRGQPRQRTTHTYKSYQRFVTGGRLVTP